MALELLSLLWTFENSTKYRSILILFSIAKRSIEALSYRGSLKSSLEILSRIAKRSIPRSMWLMICVALKYIFNTNQFRNRILRCQANKLGTRVESVFLLLYMPFIDVFLIFWVLKKG